MPQQGLGSDLGSTLVRFNDGGPPDKRPTVAPVASSAIPTRTEATTSAVVPCKPKRYGKDGHEGATIRSAAQEALHAEHEPGQQAAEPDVVIGTARTGRRPSKTSNGAPVTCSWSDRASQTGCPGVSRITGQQDRPALGCSPFRGSAESSQRATADRIRPAILPSGNHGAHKLCRRE